METKACRNCHATKPVTAFWMRQNGGRENVCSTCRNKRRTGKAPSEAPTAPPPEPRALRDAPAPRGKPTLNTAPMVHVEAPLEVGVLIPDTHAPNHDRRAWGLMLQVAHHLKPKHLVILGDFADAESLSAHPRTKPGEESMEAEVAGVQECLDQLDTIGATNKIYASGNHEYRLNRFLMKNAPQLFYAVRWQNILRLYERGWQWVDYLHTAAVGKLNITHDTGTAGMNAHRQAAATYGGSVVIGHTHRMSVEIRGRHGGVPHIAMMVGWLGDVEKAANYMHRAKAAEWVHGFGVFWLEPASGIVHVQPVPIVNGRCVVNGRLFR